MKENYLYHKKKKKTWKRATEELTDFPGRLESGNPATERSGLCPVRRNSSGRGGGQQRCVASGFREAGDKTLALLETWATFPPSPKPFP